MMEVSIEVAVDEGKAEGEIGRAILVIQILQ